MVSDSIAAAPILSAANTKNPGKKKRTNRSAKLKQHKIDARREQWLSQGTVVKSKGCKDGVDDDGHAPPLPAMKHGKRSLEPLETRHGGGEEDDGSIHQDSDLESPSNCPNSLNLCGNDSGTSFTGGSSIGGSSSSSSSSSSAGCCSGNITEEEDEEEEEGDDGCLDDWEAVADALAADDKHESPCLDSPPARNEPVLQTVLPNESNSGAPNSKPESGRLVPWATGNSRAWRADDAFRPQSLPNLSKQHSLPNPDRLFGAGVPWVRTSPPSPCPICFEDLDLTDSSFLPCLCGFRLCLFCHKRILEEDGRCPGCRKPYKCETIETETTVLGVGGSLALRLARSCSMIERS
ncbi:uncharacterized protein LOC133304297 [Gastrolobium bilobum]|uniref:uncharacterized protein LOC133304297 n=1 Tax=Gastrolobium bilobum TaxID=150636 RepID=UPI002AB07F96|nr:uncharacterized protein LOC133304297 [Gastrolobium bilobum]